MMADAETPERLSARSNATYVPVPVFLYHKPVRSGIFRIKSQFYTVKHRGGKRIMRLSRTVRIESHHGEYGPRRHGTCIVIARNTVRFGPVILVQQHLYGLLGTPLLSFEVAEKIRIGYIRFICRIIQSFIEYHLQLVYEFLLSAHQFCKAFDIMRNVESIVPGAAFVETRGRLEILALARIERRIEGSVHFQRSESTVLRTIVMSVAQGSLLETGCIPGMSERIGQQGKRVVGDIVFKGVRNRVVP